MGNIVEKYHKKDDDANEDIKSYYLSLGSYILSKYINACYYCLGSLDNTEEIDLDVSNSIKSINSINSMEENEYVVVSMEELDQP